MAHIAIINKDNLVIGVTPVANDKMQVDGIDSIELAKAHLIKCFSTNDYKAGLKDFKRKEDGSMYQLHEVDFVQTSYHENIHYNYAGVGDTWDADNMAFIKPYPNEILIKGGMSNMSSTTGSYQLNNKFKWEWVDNQSLLMRATSTIKNIPSTIMTTVREWLGIEPVVSQRFATKQPTKLSRWTRFKQWLITLKNKIFK